MRSNTGSPDLCGTEQMVYTRARALTAGKFATAVQNVAGGWHIICEIQIGFKGARNLVSLTSQFCSQFLLISAKD